MGGGIFNISAKGKIHSNKNKMNENIAESVGKIENLSKKVEGGDYIYKDDLKSWIKSFNLDNLQIIEYKTLIPIYCFIPGLESKLTICLQKFEDIVLQEIHNFIEKDFKVQENKICEENSIKISTWKVGITDDIYKSFVIYKKQISTKLIISKKNNIIKKEDIICGEVPEGFIIIGWKLKTNSYSKPFDVESKWEKEKDFKIIGSESFKFKVSISEKNNEYNEDMEVDWKLQIFRIHFNFLVKNDKYNGNYDKMNNNSNHYFINCD